jgi:hypothetical protein
LFAVYLSPVADIITSHGVRHHQYADDTRLHLAMRADNILPLYGLSVLAAYTAMSAEQRRENPDASAAAAQR